MKNYEDANVIDWTDVQDMEKALAYYQMQIVKPNVYSKPIAKRFYQNLILQLDLEIKKMHGEEVEEFIWD